MVLTEDDLDQEKQKGWERKAGFPLLQRQKGWQPLRYSWQF